MAVHVLSNIYRPPAKCIVRFGAQEKEHGNVYSLLKMLHISTSRHEAPKASLKLGSQLDSGAVWSLLQETGNCAIGDPIIIEADFGLRREQIMRGRIHSISTDTTQADKQFAVSMECQDESARLQRRRIRKTWGSDKPVNDRFIVSTVLNKYGLDLDPDSAVGSQCASLEQDATDYEFLRQRAEANCYELLFNNGPVYFGPMRLHAEPQQSILVMGAQANCARFSVRRYDQALPGFGFVRAEGELDGSHYGHVLNIGKPVEVKALDECYGGVYYVDTVTHSFTRNNYRQDFNLLRQTDADNCLCDFTVHAAALRGSLYQVL